MEDKKETGRKLTIGELQVLGGCWCRLGELGEIMKKRTWGKTFNAMRDIDSAFYDETGAFLKREACYLNTNQLKEWIEKRKKEIGEY